MNIRHVLLSATVAVAPSYLFITCTFRSNSGRRLSSCGGSSVEQPLVDSTWHGPSHKRGRQSRISLHGHIQFWQRYKGCLHSVRIQRGISIFCPLWDHAGATVIPSLSKVSKWLWFKILYMSELRLSLLWRQDVCAMMILCTLLALWLLSSGLAEISQIREATSNIVMHAAIML